MGKIPGSKTQRELDRFTQVGTGSGISTDAVEVASRSVMYGRTSTGTGKPVLVDEEGKIQITSV